MKKQSAWARAHATASSRCGTRLLALLLCAVMTLGLLPAAAFAADGDELDAKSGDLTYSVDGAKVSDFTYTNGTMTVTGNNVTVKNVTFGDGAKLVVNTTGKFTLTGCTFAPETVYDNSTKLPVRTAVTLNVGEAEVTNNTFGGVTNGYYNAIEFGIGANNNDLSKATISGNTFNSAIYNNYFNFYNMTAGAQIDIVNNKMLLANKASNGIRISNYRNVAGVTFNIADDEYTYAADSADSVYEGLILLQDYSTGSAVQDFTGITLNVTNLTAPESAKQLLYVYDDQDGIITTNQPKLTGDDSLATFCEAKIGDTYYKTLAEAIAAAKSGDTVTLLKDTTEYASFRSNVTVTLDLNDKTLYGDDREVKSNGNTWREYLALYISNGNVTIKNGTISGRVNIYDAANVKIEKDVTISNKGYDDNTDGYGIVVWGDGTYGQEGCKTPVLNLYGKVNVTGEKGVAISTNGTDASKPVINIYDGAEITSEKCSGIYLPSGALTVSGGSITGATGIYFKSTDMTVSGGTVTGNGPKAEYEFYGNGANTTGDAVVIDNCNYPSGIGKVELTGGKFKSVNADAVGSYVGNGQTTPLTGFISGGLFSSDPSDYCVSDKTGVASGDAAYPFTVGEEGETPATVDSTSVPAKTDSTDKVVQDAAKAITGASIENDAAVEAAAKDLANKNTIAADTKVDGDKDVKDKLNEVLSTPVSSNDDIAIVYQTYLDIVVSDAKADANSKITELSVNLTPMYRVVATTQTVVNSNGDIVVDEEDFGEVNAVVIKDGEKLALPEAEYEVSFPIPTNFIAEAAGSQVSIKHTKDNGQVEYYTGTVGYATGSVPFITFTTKGFSPFVISAAVASINGEVYPTLAEAVANVTDGQTIRLEADCAEEVTVSRTVKFTLDKSDKEYTGTIKAGSNTTEANAATTSVTGYTGEFNFTYTRPSSSGSSTTRYNVTVDSAKNGSVSANVTRAAKGDTVTLTVKADSGYALDAITVTDANGKTVSVTEKNGKYTFTMPASAVTVKAAFTKTSTTGFLDVDEDDYFNEAVKWAVDNGVTSGIGSGLFGSDSACTRAQIVTFLWKTAGSPVVNYAMSFTDVGDTWYTEAVRWAVSEGITSGTTDTTFSPDAPCTRAQAAVFLYRYAQTQGKGFTGAWMFQLPFTDVPEWAYESVAWCYMNGITAGTSATTFGSDDTCTRAQIVTFLYKLAK